MIKAIILAYEGVLVNAEPFTKYSIGRACERLGIPFDQATYDQYFAGKPLRTAASNFLTFVHRGDVLTEFLALKSMHEAEYAIQIEIYQDSLFFIDPIKNDFSFAIVAEERLELVKQMLNKVKRDYIFSTLVGGDEYKLRKPMSESYELALKRIELPAEEVVVIESTPSGIMAAQSAGMKCIAVTTNHNNDQLELRI